MKKMSLYGFARFAVITVLHSYGMLFFSNRKLFAALVMLVSFFNPYTGLAGLAATGIAVMAAWFIGFSREQVRTGLYTYSALLTGLGMGTFYEFSTGFWVLLVLAALFSVLLSAALIDRMGRKGLPALSLAFIFTLWIVILSAREFASIGLTERNIYWLNEMYATGGNELLRLVQWFETRPLPDALSGFLRSLSAILFQSNIAAGMVLALALLLYSRIALTLMVAGYAIAMLFIQLMQGDTGGVNYYNLGTNFMLVAVALGGFYIIPSIRSYAWALLTVPISYLLVVALWKVTMTWGLPVFSLPFCITVILFLYVLQLRRAGGKLVLTPVQYYSPEENLYRYRNSRDRVLSHFYIHRLSLPVLGEWNLSQGYEGTETHRGEWSQALDFDIRDAEGRSWQPPGSRREDFYCYARPVVAPADGVVEEVIDYVDDNEVGENNTRQNWGNTIVIKHAEGLYTQLSHLKKGSVRVQRGATVKKGEWLAHCGNSGRSPEPHLHFQVQATPYIGSRTLAYPLAYFLEHTAQGFFFRQFAVPAEKSRVSNLSLHSGLQQAFSFPPGQRLRWTAREGSGEEWEVKVSPYNELYLWEGVSGSAAYFLNDGTVFRFTQFFGDQRSLLYWFYQAAYTVLLSGDPRLQSQDECPPPRVDRHPLRWLQDFLAPFYLFMRLPYESGLTRGEDPIGGGSLELQSRGYRRIFHQRRLRFEARMDIRQGRLKRLQVTAPGVQNEWICDIL